MLNKAQCWGRITLSFIGYSYFYLGLTMFPIKKNLHYLKILSDILNKRFPGLQLCSYSYSTQKKQYEIQLFNDESGLIHNSEVFDFIDITLTNAFNKCSQIGMRSNRSVSVLTMDERALVFLIKTLVSLPADEESSLGLAC